MIVDLFNYQATRNIPTSMEGLRKIEPKKNGLHARIMLHIERAGVEGCTNSELRQMIGSVENGTMSARIRELFLEGKIQDSGMTRKGVSGVSQIVWIKR